MSRPVVAVVRTTPETVIRDYARVMELAGFREALPVAHPTLLKINISWHFWYPACSSPPWQVAGVLEALLDAGYSGDSLAAAHNRTVVVSAKLGERLNKHKTVTNAYGIKNIHLYEPSEEWVRYEPKRKLLGLEGMFPEGIRIPKRMFGSNIIHLPTVKTHVFTTMTGAMKNAFGGLLFERRHWTHSMIHETLVDLLGIQQEIHPGIFAVMDGTFAGDGAGPRAMRVHVKDLLLASRDQVAIDAVAAKLMGFDPLSIKFIRLAHEHGLGVGDVRGIEFAGDDVSAVDWKFQGAETFASRGQKLIYWGPLHRFEKFLLRSVLAPWSYLASILYHDVFWYGLIGFWRALRARRTTAWGRLFARWKGKGPGRGEGISAGVPAPVAFP